MLRWMIYVNLNSKGNRKVAWNLNKTSRLASTTTKIQIFLHSFFLRVFKISFGSMNLNFFWARFFIKTKTEKSFNANSAGETRTQITANLMKSQLAEPFFLLFGFRNDSIPETVRARARTFWTRVHQIAMKYLHGSWIFSFPHGILVVIGQWLCKPKEGSGYKRPSVRSRFRVLGLKWF